MNKENDAVRLRKLQETVANYISSGINKEIAKWEKSLYDNYIEVGFSPEQALQLVIAHIAQITGSK